MKEIYDLIIHIYFDLLGKGFNILAILLTIILVDFIKTKMLINYNWYKTKFKSLITLGFCLVISFIFSMVFYMFHDWGNIIITFIVGFGLSVASKQIMKAIYKILPGKQEDEE